MDFKSFKEKNNRNDDLKKTFDDTANRMRGKSEAELMDEISSEAERLKRAGTFNSDDLNKFCQSVSPMLNDAQKEKLKDIMKLINE